mgnify:CR=1 FL=1
MSPRLIRPERPGVYLVTAGARSAPQVAMARLRVCVGEVELIDARQRPDLFDAQKAVGQPIDAGMIAQTDDAAYLSGDAIGDVNARLS